MNKKQLTVAWTMGDIIGFKQGIWGISIDVRVLWRKLKKHIST